MEPVSGAPVSAAAPGGGTFSTVLAFKKLSAAVALAVLLPALAAGPAHAAETATPSPTPTPTPPANMSKVGGELLGRPGTQVLPAGGAPVLPKELTARSWIVADAESGEVLAAHNAHWRLAPASTLKMLFADTLLTKFPQTQKHRVAPEELSRLGEGSSLVGIKEEHTYTVRDLWLGVFLKSGNDAVHVLSAMNGGIAETVEEMNERADELQALDTRVVSPDGYDAEGQVSSAYDLTLFARSGMQNKDFREYASTVRAQFPGEEKKGEKRGSFEIANTNRLLTGVQGVLKPYRGVAGVKNGSTTHAGHTFTGVAERGGRVLLVTVMNPSSGESFAVYKEAARLLDWGFAAAGKVKPVGELVPPRSAQVETGPETEQGGTEAGSGTGEGTGSDQHAASPAGASGGFGIALAVLGGVLVLLAGIVLVVNQWLPLRRAQTPPEPEESKEEAEERKAEVP
ncbi:D-alanyl-D-alanine carboxypeptidase family protein [Streptomyces sp. MUM 203J]|uniref:D-alanyl-D-alanine carboxypeptidase family protein n=1 Tax=Streptomyces sp. MUM 203J TaxID=2791990 RepID=UPI001F037E48|nr:D-alanyl-D-alanine carboxypeptidase [Streptomyces sp. MUM 203J]